MSSGHLSLFLTCVSVSMSEVATSKRLGLDRYLLSLNWFSSSSSCWLVKAVRGLRHFPNRPDCGPAGGWRAQLSDIVHNKWIYILFDISMVNLHWFPVLVSLYHTKCEYFLCSEKVGVWNTLFIQHQGHRKFNVMWWVGQAHICTHSEAIINSFTPVYCWRGGQGRSGRRGHKNTGVPLT